MGIYSRKTLVYENKLSTKERNSLSDKIFGLPDQRKYPLHDKEHIKIAMTYFNKCDDKNKPELFANIKKACKLYDIPLSIALKEYELKHNKKLTSKHESFRAFLEADDDEEDDYQLDSDDDNDTAENDNTSDTDSSDNQEGDNNDEDDYDMPDNINDNTDNEESSNTTTSDENDDYSMDTMDNTDDTSDADSDVSTTNNDSDTDGGDNNESGSSDASDNDGQDSGDGHNTDTDESDTDGTDGDNTDDSSNDDSSSDDGDDYSLDDTSDADTGDGDESDSENSNSDSDSDSASDGSSNKGSGADPEIQKLNDEKFADLTDEQIFIKSQELKSNFLNLYNTIGTIVKRVGNIVRTDDNVKIIEFINNKLVEMKDLVYNYMAKTFDTKTYIENAIQYQECLAVLTTINKAFLALIPKDEDGNSEK